MIHTLTIHYGVNYGSALQTYALFTYLSKYEEVDVINYIPSRYFLWNYINCGAYRKKNIVVKIIHFVLKAYINIRQRKIFSKFLAQNVRLTNEYSTTLDISKSVKSGDIVVVGSDQVWNTDYNGYRDNTYLGDFSSDRVKMVSYAASIGKDSLSDNDVALFRKYLVRFSAISLREKTGENLLKNFGIECQTVIDPTFLITKEEWVAKAKDSSTKEKYILVYVMDNLHEKLLDVASKLSVKTGCKVYVVAFRKSNDERADKEIVFATPWEFLGLIKNALYVVTNSFHGMALSINLNKQFIAIGKSSYNSRMVDLLNSLQIENHFYPSDSDVDLEKINDINYDEVNEHLAELRVDANRFISQNILNRNKSDNYC